MKSKTFHQRDKRIFENAKQRIRLLKCTYACTKQKFYKQFETLLTPTTPYAPFKYTTIKLCKYCKK